MNYITLSISVLLGWLVVSTPKLLSAQTNQGSNVKVHFKKQGSLYFDYYDLNNHITQSKIINKKNIDTIIVKHIDLDRPTVFRTLVIWKNKLMVHKFIGFNTKDTISLEATELVVFKGAMSITYTIPTYIGFDKRMMLFYDMFGVSELNPPYTIPSIAEYDSKKEIAENEKSDRLKRLIALIKEVKMDSQSIQILKNYIDLCYYNQLLAVKYKNSVIQGWNHPDIARFDSVDIKNNLLLSIKSKEAQSILVNLISYNAYLNNRQDKTLFENVSLLNSRFYKTKLLDGLIFEILENKIKSLQERRQILASLKDYMLDNKDEMITLSRDGVISKEALNVKLKGYDGKTTQFDQILKGDQKIIVLDFWASWCKPCIAQIPKLKEANARLSNKIKFISLSSDADSIKWIEGCNKYNVKENSFLLKNTLNNDILKFFKIIGYPTFVVITNKGEVLNWGFIRPSEAEFDVKLQKMLEAL